MERTRIQELEIELGRLQSQEDQLSQEISEVLTDGEKAYRLRNERQNVRFKIKQTRQKIENLAAGQPENGTAPHINVERPKRPDR